jgi:hypothetical protein
MNNKENVIDIKIKKITDGQLRKYTQKDMEVRLRTNHPVLVQEVYMKSYLIENEDDAAQTLVKIFIDECLDIDTLESDEARKDRIKGVPVVVDDFWDRISEKV